MAFNTISVIGLGYIGLPTAAVIASRGVHVIGVDINEHAVNTINQGKVHIVEPDLDMLVSAAVTSGHLRATTKAEPADAFLVAVPTPFKGDHEPDLSYIESAARMIAPVLTKGNLVILESTSPVGATEQLSQWLAEARPDLSFPQQAGDQADIQVGHCPERVLPGRVLHELVQNDRIIGGMTPKAAELAVQLYKIFVRGECILTDARTAELAKLVENSFRDVNIAFANELSLICDKMGINVWELIQLANRHPRVNILQPGPGVGGHCIAVDPWFIVSQAPEQARLIHAARLVNDSKPHFVIDKVAKAAEALDRKPVVACLGLAFKPDIDDLRESPSVEITKELAESGKYRVLAVEPNIHQLPKNLQGLDIELTSVDNAITAADILLVLVDHKEFKRMNKPDLTNKKLVDTRGLWG